MSMGVTCVTPYPALENRALYYLGNYSGTALFCLFFPFLVNFFTCSSRLGLLRKGTQFFLPWKIKREIAKISEGRNKGNWIYLVEGRESKRTPGQEAGVSPANFQSPGSRLRSSGFANNTGLFTCCPFPQVFEVRIFR